ncbi:unnamed protein product [Knipowitschia caucasica]|uniref:U2 snRNP-associated SURP motif-containing protein n=1 Tax=Knipowitschia caucasica TaxID=637954 RepID=A0AAV2JCV3_KNICA
MAERKGKTAIPAKILSKKEQQELKKKEEEKAAEVFEEFLATFEPSNKSGGKTFVHGGTVNPAKGGDEAKSERLYRPTSRFAPQYVAPLPPPESKRPTFKKKVEEKKKSNLELFKEELKIIQEEREERHKRRGDSGGQGGDIPVPFTARATALYDDPTAPISTNLYISAISPKMNEEILCKEFGKYGPLASVKIMWPRNDEERNRTSNRAFVAFMTRKDAERALASLEGKIIMGFEMKLGWGRPARIPPQPLYTPMGVRTIPPPPPSGLPFNAQPRDRFRNDFTKPLGSSKAEFEKSLAEAIVKVIIPSDRNLLFLIHRMIEFVVREGPMFEAIIMNREKNNPKYRFLFDNKSQDHVYYRWRLYSILHGETPSKWKTADFRLFRGGSLWRPPILNDFSHRIEDEAETEGVAPPQEEEEEEEEEVKKGQLKARFKLKLEEMLKELTPRRQDIGNTMVFCLQRADAAEEVVALIAESLSMLETPLQKKIARLYLVSDLLHNSCAKVAGASHYRKYFESKLMQICGDLCASHKTIQARLQAEQFKQKVMNCFRAWEEWAIYPEQYLIYLQNIFLGFAKPEEEVVEMPKERPCDLDGAPIDGLPLSRADELDGCPLGWDPLDGEPVDDLDGVPLGTSIDDIDGLPLEDGPHSRVPLSKWEQMGDSSIVSSVKTSSKWDNVEEQEHKSQQKKKNGGTDDSDSDSSDSCSSSSKYESADFQSSLKSFQMSEIKRKRLRELEVKVLKMQDELESGKRQRKSGMSIQQQVEYYRNKLLQREFDKETVNSKTSTTKEKSKDDRRREESRRGRSKDSDGRRSTKSRSRSRSPKRSRRSRTPSPNYRREKSRSRSPHRSHKKTKKSKH